MDNEIKHEHKMSTREIEKKKENPYRPEPATGQPEKIEDRYRNLVEHSLQGIIVIQDFRIVYTNAAFERISGYTVGELQNLQPEKIQALVHPEDQKLIWGRFRDRLSGKQVPPHYEFRGIRKDNAVRWFDLYADRVEYRGRPAIQSSMIDITERKEAEKTLLIEKAYLEELFENAPEAIVLVDNDSSVIRANREFTRTFGYTEEEIKGHCVDDLLAPEELHEVAVSITKRIKKGERVTVETVRRRKDGTWVDVSISGLPIRVEGKQVAVYGMYRDISERKHAEKEIRKSEEKYRVLVENATDVIVIIQDDLIKFHNQKTVTLTGYTKEELEAAHFSDFIHHEDREIMIQRYGKTLAGDNNPSPFPFRVLQKSGAVLWGEINSVQILWEDRPAVLSFIRDITGEKKLRDQLQHAQKMEAVGTLAGGIAHDFNNLLQGILGYADLLILNKENEEPEYRELEQIRNAAHRAAELTQQLLTFSRKVESKMRPVNLNNSVNRIHALVKRTIPKMIEIKLNPANRLRIVNADPAQVEQVLMNLIVNSKDAMPEGGILTITTKNKALDDKFCRLHLGSIPGEYVLVNISDTGHGMDKETLEHIFEPFYTTKDKGRGTGLGLAMVYGIVKSHNGYIECKSKPGGGTSFWIYFPVIDDIAELKDENDSEITHGGSETILLVDDEEFIRNLVEHMLGGFGYSVLTASDGKSALEIFGQRSREIDLIILDLIMPGISGGRCLEELLKINPEAKVIIASGYAEDGLEMDAITAQARGFIGKPFKISRMLGLIRNVLDEDTS